MQSKSRFERDANRYAAYLETPEGRLRSDLAFENLQEVLPVSPANNSLSALDVGCGTGEGSLRLARLGFRVTLLDSAGAMLQIADQGITQAGLGDRAALTLGDAAQLCDLFAESSFDLIICHNVLEYVEDPGAILRSVAVLLRNSSALLSVLVRSQAGEVLKSALKSGDLALAAHNLSATCATESLYGGNVRTFTAEALESMLKDASLTVSSRRGVRVVADYLPARISRAARYNEILSLERELGRRSEFYPVARYMQCLARSASGASTEDE